MSTRENKSIVRRYITEVVNTGDVENIASFISEEYVEVHHNTRHVLGIEGAKRHIRGVREAYPDLQLSIEGQIAEGDWVVTQITARGTHRGLWLGMNPTGRTVAFAGVNINRVVGGLIVEHAGAANLLEPLLEIGAIQVTDPVDDIS